MTEPVTTTEPKAADVTPPQVPAPAAPTVSRRSIPLRVIDFLGGFAFAITLLALLTLLTWLGTLNQVAEGLRLSQQRYFESWFLVHRFEAFGLDWGVPLPGGALLMSLFALNLTIGGLIRIRKSTATVGIIIAHIGIVMLLLAGLVKWKVSTDGRMVLWPSEKQAWCESYFDWEIEIAEVLEDGKCKLHLIPGSDFQDMGYSEQRRFESPDLPFDLTLLGYSPNSFPVGGGPGTAKANRGPEIDGWRLEAVDPHKEAAANIAGAYAILTEKKRRKQHKAILWGIQYDPLVRDGDPPLHRIEVEGKTFGIRLRHLRWPLPFSIELDEFRRTLHPRTGRAKSFESDVIVHENDDTRRVNISMNDPLRTAGYVVFQESWGPQRPDYRGKLYSQFAVADNPSDQWPLYSCIVIGIGLLIHFIAKLYQYVRAERRRATRVAV